MILMEMALKTGHLPGEKMERIEIYNDSMKDAVFAFTDECFHSIGKELTRGYFRHTINQKVK